MFVNCKALTSVREVGSFSDLGKLLKQGDLISPSGNLKEELKVFMGGAFFKEPGEEASGFPWVFSTFDLDRDDEKIDPAGWELKHYLENPVILWAHDSRIPAIGRSEGTAVTEGALRGRIFFNEKEYDPFGWGIGQRVAQGVIRAGSVGFLVNKVEVTGREDDPELIFREQELLEFSICNIPSNPYALSRESEQLTETAENRFWDSIIRNPRRM